MNRLLRPITALVLIAITISVHPRALADAPELSSWIRNTTGLTGYNNLPANVQKVQYSADNFYISASGIPAYSIGPWPGNPNTPTNQNFVVKFTRHPAEKTGTKTATPLGPIGLYSNGVAIFNSLDAHSYNNQNIWHQNAVVVEAGGFDACHGHTAPGGTYHHHQNPLCLYVANNTEHSAILGFAFDGYPVYGPYGFANTDGTGAITRMRTSYRTRNISQRTTLPDGTVLSASQYGPAVSATYPLGYYAEDFEYVSGLGDLDAYNGRFCVTPEYPAGTYAYFITIDSAGNSAYPYAIGPSYYGVVPSTSTHVTISEAVTQYSPSALTAVTLSEPADQVTGQGTSIVVRWETVAGAALYQLQIATDPGFTANTSNGATVADTFRTVSGLDNNTTYYWRVRAINGADTGSYSSTYRFTTKLGKPAIVRTAGIGLQVTIEWTTITGAANYDLALATDSLFSAVILRDSLSADTAAAIGSLSANTTYYSRVRALGTSGASDWSPVASFTTGDSTTATVSYSYTARWNMVSIPMRLTDPRSSVHFPTATSGPFSYAGSYAQSDTMHHGQGYWLKFASAQSVALTGTPVLADTVEVVPGWNLIGSVAADLSTSNIASDPPSIVTSSFHGYASRYFETNVLAAGAAYWVKVTGAGKLILNGSAGYHAPQASRIRIVRTEEMPPEPPVLAGAGMAGGMPHEYILAQNYPNPFNPSTRIEFTVPSASPVSLRIYDMVGKAVATLVDGRLDAGKYSATWEPSGLPSGIYVCRLNAGTVQETRRLVYMK